MEGARVTAIFRAFFAVVILLVPLASISAGSQPAMASGGCEGTVTPGTGYTSTAVGGDCVLSFHQPGTYSWSPPEGVTSADVLIVGGGGGGGGGAFAGGGGGGGVLLGAGVTLPAGTISVIVGAGGSGGSAVINGNIAARGSSGESSQFGPSAVALGGGGGGGFGYTNSDVTRIGLPGGSGGGSSESKTAILGGETTQTSVSGFLAYGNNGGGVPALALQKGAGGGGAGSAGADTTGTTNSNSTAGAGGAGQSFDITGSSVVYAAGGDGGSNDANRDGVGGAAGSGNGGGGASFQTSATAGGSGGSGVVVVRFASGSGDEGSGEEGSGEEEVDVPSEEEGPTENENPATPGGESTPAAGSTLSGPAIALELRRGVGQPAEGLPVVFGGLGLPPGTPYTLTVAQPVMVLESGVANTGGIFGGTRALSALPAGTHTVVLRVELPSGEVLQLSTAFEIGSDGLIISISDTVIGESTVAPEPQKLAYTGIAPSPLPLSSGILIMLGLFLLVYSVRGRAMVVEDSVAAVIAVERTPWEILATPIRVPGIDYVPGSSVREVGTQSLSEAIRDIDAAMSRLLGRAILDLEKKLRG